MPPIVVYGPDSRGKYFLSEGWHRLAAHRLAGRSAISATIRSGGWKEALEHALGSNAQHGLPRSSADKRHAVKLALTHWAQWSNGVIAEKCAVSKEMVGDIRPRQVSDSDTCLGPVIGKDGKTYPPTPKRPPPKSPQQDENPAIEQSSAPKPRSVEGRSPPQPKSQTPALPTDQLNQTVPPHLVALWERRSEVQQLLDDLAHIHRLVQQAQDDRDPLYCGAGQGNTPINFNSVLGQLKQARSSIKEAMPYAVCPMCQGTGCRSCSGNGLISKFRYDTIIPAERKVQVPCN